MGQENISEKRNSSPLICLMLSLTLLAGFIASCRAGKPSQGYTQSNQFPVTLPDGSITMIPGEMQFVNPDFTCFVEDNIKFVGNNEATGGHANPSDDIKTDSKGRIIRAGISEVLINKDLPISLINVLLHKEIRGHCLAMNKLYSLDGYSELNPRQQQTFIDSAAYLTLSREEAEIMHAWNKIPLDQSNSGWDGEQDLSCQQAHKMVDFYFMGYANGIIEFGEQEQFINIAAQQQCP